MRWNLCTQAQIFNGSMTLLTTLGWSTVTCDGMIDSPIEPRTSSRTFHFGEADKHAVEELRQWAASQLLANESTVPLSSVHPKMFFDLTCQLLAKARMDTRCMLLKVWYMRLFITLYGISEFSLSWSYIDILHLITFNCFYF